MPSCTKSLKKEVRRLAREERIVVKVSYEVKEKFQEYAEAYGLTMSSLAAFVIGQWLNGQEKTIKPIMDKMVLNAVNTDEKMTEFMTKFMQEFMPKMIQEMQQKEEA